MARCYWAETTAEARRLEREVHRRLTEQSKWLHGEWFDMKPEAASEMMEFVSMVAAVDISREIPNQEIADEMKRARELYHDPKRALELRRAANPI